MKVTTLTIAACLAGCAAWADTASVGNMDQAGQAGSVSIQNTGQMAQTDHKTPVYIPEPQLEDVTPEEFKAVPGLNRIPPIARMNTWAAQGTNMLFMEEPETGTLIAGFAFDKNGESLHPGLSDAEGAGIKGMIEELFGQVIDIPDQFAPTVDERLKAMSEKDRSAAIAELITAVSGVDGEKAFNAAIAGWLEGLDARRDGNATGNESEGLSLIEAVRHGFWMRVGDEKAPVLYAITDPSCAPCRLSVDIFRDKVEAGELQLRILMLPMQDDDSLGTIAGILTAEDPAKTYLNLSLEENAELPFARTAGMPDIFREGIQSNYAMAKAFEVPQLPYYAFETMDGPVYIAGAPGLDQIAGALPPSEEPLNEPEKTSGAAAEVTEEQD